jgi:hypothetical protein
MSYIIILMSFTAIFPWISYAQTSMTVCNMLRRAVTNPIGNHLGFEAYPTKYKLAQNTVNVK